MAKLKHKKRKSFWKRVRFKYKLYFFNESTLEEVWAFRVSQLSAFVAIILFVFGLITITSLVIIKTPIRNYLPGYLDNEVRNSVINNALRADSLEQVLRSQSLYLKNVSEILSGNITVDSVIKNDSIAYIKADYNIPRSEKEINYVNAYEEQEKFNLTVFHNNPILSDDIFFFKPVNGVVSARYDADVQHFGVDLVAAPKESILATLDGIVVYIAYEEKDGNVICLQHNNGFISIYKHNETLLKKVGEHVVAGEAIALIGNTGTLSTGPHLHFELWYKGSSVNPEEYIAF